MKNCDIMKNLEYIIDVTKNTKEYIYELENELKSKETKIVSLETLIKNLSERVENLESKNKPLDVKSYSFFK
jgi:chromosome segregation ATPase